MHFSGVHERIRHWFHSKGWQPFDFQLDVLREYDRVETGLVHAPTGMGKTVAALLPVIHHEFQLRDAAASGSDGTPDSGLKLLWITPLRALAGDTVHSIQSVLTGHGIDWKVEARTGDTSASRKARQRKALPDVLVTTPESLSLLISYPESTGIFNGLRSVVVDEWHELLGSKRGTQTELGLAHLRRRRPALKVWGLSATLANLDLAVEVLAGTHPRKTAIVSGRHEKEIHIESLFPDSMDCFPWAGHLGLALLDRVLEVLDRASTSLVFTNTRSQTESWFHAIRDARPQWDGAVAIHHGSIDRKEREPVEQGLKDGSLKVVVCTSSLDLGVDFIPVEQVIQIGGPKGIARLLQRAGRSGHQPGRPSRIVCVPAHSLELVEYAAVRRAIATGRIEPRNPLEKPFDLLVQHVVTLCLGEPRPADEIFAEIRSAWAYRDLTRTEFDWALDFIQFGGKSLRAYKDYSRLMEEDGKLHPRSNEVGKFHRMGIGTITSDTAVPVKFKSGKTLGSVEESFISRIRPGQVFIFSGRTLQLEKFHANTAYVRAASGKKPGVPSWDGGRTPLSSQLADAVLEQLECFARGELDSEELRQVAPVLNRQADSSILPLPDTLLIENTRIRRSQSWFVYAFGGRLAHEGLVALVAWRITEQFKATVVTSVNDYGFHLSVNCDLPADAAFWNEILGSEDLEADLLECLNASEMAKRQFREIARVAGLIFSGYPGARKSARQVQVSSQLLYEVFSRYEPEHLLLDQARREVLQQQLEINRLRQLLEKIHSRKIQIVSTGKLTPMAFPLWAEMIRGEISSESWTDRVRKMAEELSRDSTAA